MQFQLNEIMFFGFPKKRGRVKKKCFVLKDQIQAVTDFI